MDGTDDLAIGVLTWRAPETLRQTLESHRAAGIDRLVSERVVFVQARGEDPRSVEIAREFGYRVEGSADNLGILGGIDALARCLRTPLVLFNENDFQIDAPPETVARELRMACSLVREDRADIVWLRSREHPGRPFVVREKTEQFHPPEGATRAARVAAALRRTARPDKARRMAARSIRFDADAPRAFPDLIEEPEPGWSMARSRWLSWSNNPCVLRRDLLLTLLDRAAGEDSTRRTNGFRNLEVELNSPWWRAQDLRIVQAPGIFTHDRIGDRGYA